MPLEFITFAYMEGKMYRFAHSKGTFVVQDAKQRWGNDVVYGALFLVNDFHFYIRTLDAYQGCSLSMLGKNHSNDLQHRVHVPITPITFSTRDEFLSLRYKEKESIEALAYVGNLKHPKITQRVYSDVRPYRIIQGIDKPHFVPLLREVLNDAE